MFLLFTHLTCLQFYLCEPTLYSLNKFGDITRNYLNAIYYIYSVITMYLCLRIKMLRAACKSLWISCLLYEYQLTPITCTLVLCQLWKLSFWKLFAYRTSNSRSLWVYTIWDFLIVAVCCCCGNGCCCYYRLLLLLFVVVVFVVVVVVVGGGGGGGGVFVVHIRIQPFLAIL